jgi:outer membrane protein assembly factor BamB
MSVARRRAARVSLIAMVGVGAVVVAGTPFTPMNVAPAEASENTLAAAGELDLELAWERVFMSSQSITTGSPGVADLDGQGDSVIVGTADGLAVAMHLSDGSTVDGWPYRTTKSVAITSTPSTTGTGSAARVFFGVGTAEFRTKGGYLALKANGTKAWYRQVHLLPNNKGELRGVMSSLAVGNLHSGTDVVGGAMGQMQLAMRASSGATIPGFPWLQADTNFSTPALAAISSATSRDYIIEGGDSTAGRSYYQTYKNGGHIRILGPKGNSGKKAPNEGLRCQLNTNQVVQSSPAVGRILTGNKIGVVVGTGVYYKNASDTNRIIAMNTSCKRTWSTKLDSDTRNSPAIADVLGRGTFDVVTVTHKGTVYALNGTNGHVIWKRALGKTTDGSVTTFKAPDGDYQYVLAPTQAGLYILDGRDGSTVAKVGDFRLRSSATVTRDPDGSIGITIAGGTRVSGSSGYKGIVQHYRLVGSSVDTIDTPGSWPMFHHDRQLTGYSKEPLVVPEP